MPAIARPMRQTRFTPSLRRHAPFPSITCCSLMPYSPSASEVSECPSEYSEAGGAAYRKTRFTNFAFSCISYTKLCKHKHVTFATLCEVGFTAVSDASATSRQCSLAPAAWCGRGLPLWTRRPADCDTRGQSRHCQAETGTMGKAFGGTAFKNEFGSDQILHRYADGFE